MFEIKGTINGVKAYCKYENKKLTGDELVLEKAYNENAKNHGRLGYFPDNITSDYLNNELSAIQLLRKKVFDEGSTFTNDWNGDAIEKYAENPTAQFMY